MECHSGFDALHRPGTTVRINAWMPGSTPHAMPRPIHTRMCDFTTRLFRFLGRLPLFAFGGLRASRPAVRRLAAEERQTNQLIRTVQLWDLRIVIGFEPRHDSRNDLGKRLIEEILRLER